MEPRNKEKLLFIWLGMCVAWVIDDLLTVHIPSLTQHTNWSAFGYAVLAVHAVKKLRKMHEEGVL